MRYRLAVLLLLPLTACGAESPAPAPAGPPSGPRAVVPGERFGPLTARTGEDELLRLFGPDSVHRADVAVAEGEVRAGTLLFPGTPDQLEILWHTESLRCPELARAREPGSRWSAPGGVGVGTPLARVEEANGRPFTLWGFEWDLGGYVMDWGGGALAGLGLRLEVPAGGAPAEAPAEWTGLTGPVELSSDAPEVRRVAPVVTTMFMTWPVSPECAAAAG